MGAGGEFSIRKSTRAALPKLNIGIGLQCSGSPELVDVGGAFLYGASPLQDNRGKAVSGQKERGEQARRAHAHHHRGERGFPAHRREFVRLGLVQAHQRGFGPAGQGRFVGGGDIYCTDIVDIGFFAGVDGLPCYRPFRYRFRFYAQKAGGLSRELRGLAVQREGDIFYPYHLNHLALFYSGVFWFCFLLAGAGGFDVPFCLFLVAPYVSFSGPASGGLLSSDGK